MTMHALLHHEAGHVAGVAADEQHAALHRDAGPRRAVAADDDRAAADRRRRAVAGVAVDDDRAGQHALGQAPAGAAVDVDGRRRRSCRRSSSRRCPRTSTLSAAEEGDAQVVPGARVADDDSRSRRRRAPRGSPRLISRIARAASQSMRCLSRAGRGGATSRGGHAAPLRARPPDARACRRGRVRLVGHAARPSACADRDLLVGDRDVARRLDGDQRLEGERVARVADRVRRRGEVA